MDCNPDLKPRSAVVPGLMCVLLLATGCGTLENGRHWGQDAIYPVDLRRVSRAARGALFDLQTIIPAAGALIFAVDDFDERVSDWETEHNPVFGSERSARDASDALREALRAEALLTALATPSGEDPERWVLSKAKGIGVEVLAWGVTQATTGVLKEATDRSRPGDSDDESFPSGHSSGAFSAATLASRNLDSIRLPGGFRPPLKAGNVLLAASCAWARVEGNRHFPSDVLAGAALGHFLSAFIHDAFLGLPERTRFDFLISPFRGGAVARVCFCF
jgi:membrane-associated phospholipid phosphatase